MKKITLRNVTHEFEILDVESIIFDIYVEAIDRVVGRCEFRYETGRDLWFYGHIGYVIYPPYRGHNYAYKACMQMFAYLRKEKGLQEFVITCNPDNIASKKTILKMNHKYIGCLDVDEDHELYAQGEPQKEVFVVSLS
ncbi:GNAT family N-acetyltransferase [Erysipelothrix urinaevulpis]|uniref:GNAT family N-acetyltransferase n=1 Tax=Erysipelothrix urinaevulpis TaxID=2683717 RepID=UPI001357476A|nr:GNAT family N-acetyltransferase [Erysipelothrix urinaevulpis]